MRLLSRDGRAFVHAAEQCTGARNNSPAVAFHTVHSYKLWTYRFIVLHYCLSTLLVRIDHRSNPPSSMLAVCGGSSATPEASWYLARHESGFEHVHVLKIRGRSGRGRHAASAAGGGTAGSQADLSRRGTASMMIMIQFPKALGVGQIIVQDQIVGARRRKGEVVAFHDTRGGGEKVREVNVVFDGDIVDFPNVLVVVIVIIGRKRADHPLVVRPDNVVAAFHAVDRVGTLHEGCRGRTGSRFPFPENGQRRQNFHNIFDRVDGFEGRELLHGKGGLSSVHRWTWVVLV